MPFAILAPLISPLVNKLVDRIPDPNERARAAEELQAGIMEAANAASLAQTEINKTEAAHKSIFVAGWRPFIGWVCGAGIAWAFLIQPIAQWALVIWGPEGQTLPVIETGGLFSLVTAMLGMGGLRTFEKLKGVARAR